jgi:predicted dehydrogenase
MSANGKIGIAIQGAGTVSSGHLRAYLRNPHCRVVAIGSRTKEGAAAKAREVGLDPATLALYDSVDELVADPNVDAMSICTPHHRHPTDAIAAAGAGKHFIVEKPMAVSREEAHAMDVAVTKAGVKTVVGFVLRFNPMVETAFALARDGFFGDLLYVQTDYWHNPEQSGYPGSENHVQHMDSSAMMLGGCHAVDLARHLMGSDIVSVSAVETAGDPTAPFPPMQSAVVTFANGKIGKISACVEQWMPYQFNVDLLGTDGAIRDNRFFSRKLVGATDWTTFPTVTPNSGLVSHHPFDGEIDHFIDCVRNNVESHVSVHDAVNTHEAVFAIDRSSKQGGVPVPLPLTNEGDAIP